MGAVKECWVSLFLHFAVVVGRLRLVQAQCSRDGVILASSSGNFSSPNYPSNYPNSRTCRWTIVVPEGHRVQLTFQTFLLETCLIPSTCTCDHVEIRDGSDGNSPSLGRFCSNNKPSPIQSSGRFLWIEFDSDLTINEKGFLANYNAIAISTTVQSTTSPDTTPTTASPDTTPTTASPASPAIPTTVPSTTTPDTPTTASSDTPTKTNPDTPTTATPGTLTTASSDTTPTTAFPVQAQCNKDGVILTGSSGSFSSPNYPSNYPNSRTCRWIISVPQGHRVQLTFQTFLLEICLISSTCTCDHVEIRDGSDGNSPSLGKFCSNNKPSPIQSSGRYLWIEFDSDFTTNEKGFLATYTAVAIPTTIPAKNPPEKSVCSNSKHPTNCSNSLTPICCHDNGPSCCRTGGSRCTDGAATRDYCPRPSDDPSKGKCCLDDNGEPSCCEDRTECLLKFIGLGHLSPTACIGAIAGLVIGVIVALLFVCFCCIMLIMHPEHCCIIPCFPCIMCWECCKEPVKECADSASKDCCNPEYCCIPCIMCWECCEKPVKKCKGCRKGCGCRRCACDGCDCGGCDCGGWECGDCDSCGDCGKCDCGDCECCGDCGKCDCGDCDCCSDCGKCDCCSDCGNCNCCSDCGNCNCSGCDLCCCCDC